MSKDRFTRLKDLLIRLQGLPENERRAYLDDACKDDPELRREAESLLAHARKPNEFLETGAIVSPGALSPDDEGLVSASKPTVAEQLGGYRILRRLGEGGMGTVYLAEDAKLGRSVALKFLRPDSVGGGESTARFLHEARAAAALDHPNVCTIYEINESGGQTFISMAYVEGMTLRERMASGPLSIEETVDIGLQIAQGLRHAHGKGIVHRDIKPSNVMLSAEGPVKIMDFGLARSGDRSQITKTGARMGTAGYMSPEQMEGEAVDARTDIWALGVVLYEMLAGALPFKGDSDHAIGYNIVHGKAGRIGEAREDVPPALEVLIERCLEKKPKDRLEAADAVQVLEALRRPTGEADAAGLLRRRRRAGAGILAIAGLAVVAVLVAVGLWRGWIGGEGEGPPREPSLRRLTDLPDDVSNALLAGAISPDGRYLALPLRYLRGGWAALGVISVETGRMRHIPGPAGEVYSAGWMPDGETILTFEYKGDLPWRARWYSDASRSQIWLRNIVLNTSKKIYEHPTYTTNLWPVASPDGKHIAMIKGNYRAIWVMDATGDNLRKILEIPSGESLGRSLVWSPSASRVAYFRSYQEAGMSLLSLETCDLEGHTTVVLEGETGLYPGFNTVSLCWLPDGRLLFGRYANRRRTACDLWSVPVDPVTGVREGKPETFLGIEGMCIDQPTVSADGRRLAFYKWGIVERPRLLELNEDGDSVGVGRWTSQDWPAFAGGWTRDGKRVFFTVEMTDNDLDIYVADIESGLEEPVVKTPEQDCFQCLTPDGSELLFWQGDVLKRMPVDGGPAVEILRSPTPIVQREDALQRVKCATKRGGRCVLKGSEGEETVFYEFDPVDGTTHGEVARLDPGLIPRARHWELSPDGQRLVIVANGLWVLELRDGSLRNLKMDWRGRVRQVSWSGDGTWLCVTGTMGEVTEWMGRVDLDGGSRFLWRSEAGALRFACPSPDGSYVALTTSRDGAEVWMMEDF